MLGLLVQNQSHRAGTHLRGKLLRRIAHQTFFSGELVSANPGAVHTQQPASSTILRIAAAPADAKEAKEPPEPGMRHPDGDTSSRSIRSSRRRTSPDRWSS